MPTNSIKEDEIKAVVDIVQYYIDNEKFPSVFPQLNMRILYKTAKYFYKAGSRNNKDDFKGFVEKSRLEMKFSKSV